MNTCRNIKYLMVLFLGLQYLHNTVDYKHDTTSKFFVSQQHNHVWEILSPQGKLSYFSPVNIPRVGLLLYMQIRKSPEYKKRLKLCTANAQD